MRAHHRRSRRLTGVLAACLLGGLLGVPAAGADSTWIVSNNPTGADLRTNLGFGTLGDVFLAGDWDGNGTDTPGVFRQRNGAPPLWILSNSPTGAGPLISFAWGNVIGDEPIVGDWDGNGSDEAGIFRPDTAAGVNLWMLASANVAGGGTPKVFTFGNVGDRPIKGDWNGNGSDTVGLYRPTGGAPEWVTADANQTAPPGTTFSFGNPNDLPLTGDWNGDRADTIGLARDGGGGALAWFTAFANNTATDGTNFQFGDVGMIPIIGDWDGNGTDTPGVVRPAVEFVPPPAPPGTPATPGTLTATTTLAPGAPNGQNASRTARLTAGYKGRSSRSRRLGFTSRPTITGRLVDGSGGPIGGAIVDVLARRRQFRAPTTAIGSFTTNDDGSFSYKLPSGPSRTITFAYTAFGGDPQPAAKSAALRTIVAASLTARMSPRSPRVGELVHVAGTLRNLPRSRVQVTIQARRNGTWNTVGNVKTSAGGRYSWGYRFTQSNRGRTFTFRAHVDSPIYPFHPGNSRAFSVRVR